MNPSRLPRWRIGAGVLMLTAATALTGCASQATPENRYTLPDVALSSTAETHPSQTRKLWLRPVQVASFLDQDGIVMQLSDIELTAANQNLWAEGLGDQLTRRLRQSLMADLPGATLVGGGQASSESLTVTVDRFQGRYDGQAVVSGEWQLHDGNRLMLQQPFDVTEPLPDDGYPALVRTLGKAWQTVADQIAARIRNQPAPDATP
ncbi:ABC-type transport auxiliary lipoprotein family protein [Salinicola rhizosphaerae]|uniref:Lipoprotein n=1 Tax=Salinicola rhizosphaerae TaxID=1443141 RepID=A0ABQ3DRQ2_9GAMM|nr:ABC-type transport auxiliary lipoprotein family protein [Salinicola rhizosphaerae]GHB10158.1 lipoprotein [Salinicola rhizosphaerae]